MKEIRLSDMKDFRVENAENIEGATGCTVMLCEKGAFAGVDVRGGSPATRETDLLNPVNTVQQIHGVMLSGGSAFGLEAADGAMQFLDEQGIGFDTGFGKVPIVCGASLFDLELVTNQVRPDKAMGYAACQNAFANKAVLGGNHGVGTGACVGKARTLEHMMKTGLGIYAVQAGAVQVAAVVVVNAFGGIIDYETREPLAGMLTEDRSGIDDVVQALYQGIETPKDFWGGNTTLGCILTNARLTKDQCNKLASIAHDGYAQTIRPVHTSADGDTIFVMATGEEDVGFDAMAALATECMARAINRSALDAEAAYGLKAARDFR